MDDDFRVLIFGAGLSGLCIAHGLLKHNIPFAIFEKESVPRDRNWGVTISWAVPFMEKCLPQHLIDRLAECQPDEGLVLGQGRRKLWDRETILVRNGVTGEALVEAPFPRIRRMQLGKTRRIWGEGLDVKFGKVVKAVETPAEGGVVVQFEDGTVEKGSVLIGMDGGSSWVRTYLLGPEKGQSEDLGYVFLNFKAKYTAEQARWLDETMHPVVDVAVHPHKPLYVGLFVLDKPDLNDPAMWVFYFLVSWPKEVGVIYEKDKDLRGEFQSRMKDSGSPFKEAAEWISPDTTVRIVPGGLRIFAPKERWDNRQGRVTMGGDAAHSMTQHRGQGGNNALRDAERFVAAILEVKTGSKTLQEAVDSYDEDVFTRGLSEVEMSTKQTHAFHDFEVFMQSPVVKHGIKPTARNIEGASSAT